MRALTVCAIAALAVDQGSKQAVIYGLDLITLGAIDVAPPYLRFVMAWNQGINFGVLSSNAEAAKWLLIAVSVAISIGLALWVSRRPDGLAKVAAGLVIGGALGNVIDRLRYGAVADFLNMSCCGLDNPYVFNLADVFIFAGAAGLVLFTGDGRARPGRKGEE